MVLYINVVKILSAFVLNYICVAGYHACLQRFYYFYFTAGTWEYADSDGAAWQPIPLYEPPELSESEVEMSMTLLSPTALVRFSLSSEYVALPIMNIYS